MKAINTATGKPWGSNIPLVLVGRNPTSGWTITLDGKWKN